MKKTVIALAIAALAATSTASAATIYNQDGTKVEFSGSMRIFLGKLASHQRGDLVNDGSRVIINASHELDNGLSAFVGYELRFNDKKATKPGKEQDEASDFGDPTTNKLFVGLGFENVGKLSFGRQATNADDVLGDSLYYNSGELNPLTTGASKSVKFRSADFSGFSFGADYLFGNPVRHSKEKSYKSGYQASAFYNYDFAENHKIDFALTYGVDQFDSKDTSTTDRKVQKWVFATHYQIDELTLGAAYGQTYDKVKGSNTEKGHYTFVEAKYDLNNLTGIPTTLGLQWERLSTKKNTAAPSEITNNYIASLDYKFNKHLLTYVAYNRETHKNESRRTADNVYGAGLRVFF